MTTPVETTPRSTGAAAGQMRRIVHQLRTEGGTPARDAVAIGTGVFVGCSPFYGLHLAICWLAGRLLRLNRLKMYLASNVSNPVMAPFLILAELQAGAWIRRGAAHPLSIETVRTTDPWVFGADVLVGSLIVGGSLGVIAGLLTWLGTRPAGDPVFAELVRRAADRYVATSITAWEFARGKMRGDPLYRTVVAGGILPSGGVLVDVGCGQGLMLALLAEAQRDWASGAWRSAPPPLFERLIGIEARPRVARLAQRALGADATVLTGDARSLESGPCHAVLFFDVLHMMPADDQLRLIGRMTSALETGGVMLVREADAAAGWRFRAVRAGNRFKALLFGHWRQPFHFRTSREWVEVFERAGYTVEVRAAREGTPFGNVLFVLTKRSS
jgi:uncharacterized protein (DUF2062 family)